MIKLATIVLMMTLGLPLAAADWVVDHTQSEIKFSGTHAGSEFDGVFKNWQADIRFDVESLSDSKVSVRIKTASAETGNGLYDGTLKGEDWFDVANHDLAVFEAAGFKQLAEGRYLAEGNLTIKNKTLPFAFEFDLLVDGDTATMTATQSLDRIAFGLGVNSDADAAWVSRAIGLALHVVAREG